MCEVRVKHSAKHQMSFPYKECDCWVAMYRIEPLHEMRALTHWEQGAGLIG